MASETTLANLNSVTVEVKNTYDSEVNGKIKLTSPEGWTAESEKEISIPAGETQYVEFKVDFAKKVPFNEYCFNISVEDEKRRGACAPRKTS
ncbi:MAG: NEW3 domain-containing protein [Clostridiales bacterium]|nr:MAG: NEW3 domain-containing protein [Clostridiales bacterium]